MKYLFAFFVFGLFFVFGVAPAVSQDIVDVQAPALPSNEEDVLRLVEEEIEAFFAQDIFIPPDIPSMLFLPGEHSALVAAKANFQTRLPTESELQQDMAEEGEVIEAIREIALGGILYVSDKDWVIWLNSQRVTPDAIPSEVMDIDVRKEFVLLRWFDRQTNKIFPVRLLPNQRFNLDARMFLPG